MSRATEILELVRAGFTRNDILILYRDENQAPAPAAQPAAQPAENNPAPAAPAQPAQPAGNQPAAQPAEEPDSYARILQELTTLNNRISNINVLTSGTGQPQQQETMDDFIAKIIAPKAPEVKK